MSEALIHLDSDLIERFKDPKLKQAVREAIQAKTIAAFPAVFERLLDIAGSEDERSALTAIKLLATMGGFIVNKSQLDVRLTFDDLRARKSDDPLSSLFDVKEVVDGEVMDE